jgi:hypothetical protein
LTPPLTGVLSVQVRKEIPIHNGILFNVTPSPGATSGRANAEADRQVVLEYLGSKEIG